MTKTWIICIDGTWNQPGQRDKDPITAQEEGAPSNVVRTWEALANTLLATEFYYGSIAPLKPKILFTGVEGEVIYLAGIGTSGTVNTHILEGATGTGTSERIRDAYRYLAERYCPDDRIYGFGFSRGAFTMRLAIALIASQGLVRSDDEAETRHQSGSLSNASFGGRRPTTATLRSCSRRFSRPERQHVRRKGRSK